MPFWLFMGLWFGAVLLVLVVIGAPLVLLSRRAVRRKALRLFPGADQEQERAVWTQIRELEGGPLALPVWSARYRRRVVRRRAQR